MPSALFACEVSDGGAPSGGMIKKCLMSSVAHNSGGQMKGDGSDSFIGI